MANEWAQLASYGSRVEADLDRARLEQAGIEARTVSDDVGGAYPVLQGHGCRLLVRAEDRGRAWALLADAPAPPPEVDSPEALAAAEAEVATRGGGRLVLFGAPPDIVLGCLLLGLFFGFVASRAGYFTSDFVLDYAGDAQTEDLDGDKRADEWTYYWGPYAARIDQDRNFDGAVDATWRFVDGRVSEGERDDDFDGRIDSWSDWSPAWVDSERNDVDGDGTPDVDHYYEYGVLKRSEYRPSGGALERIDVYEGGQLRAIRVIDESGEQKLLVAFDEFGRVVEPR